jgi:hypothetical protein
VSSKFMELLGPDWAGTVAPRPTVPRVAQAVKNPGGTMTRVGYLVTGHRR